MTDHESKALAQIAGLTDPQQLRQMVENAKGKSEAVEKAAFRRLIEVSAKASPDPVRQDCWAMIHTVEELRRAKGRKVSRMNRLRRKIDVDGEVASLEYCALHRTDGFEEVLSYGLPELTAEAIVLKHSTCFSAHALAAARTRLTAAGIDLATLPSLTSTARSAWDLRAGLKFVIDLEITRSGHRQRHST